MQQDKGYIVLDYNWNLCQNLSALNMQIFVIVWYLALMLNVIDGISVAKYELKLKLNNNKLNCIFISLFEYFSE